MESTLLWAGTTISVISLFLAVMRRVLLISLLWVSFLPYEAFAQEYSYTHYDIAEGLASTKAYCITEDSEGFIWVGTETGVSRFDGTHFTNFTTADGLTDIEVLQIFGDSKGRVWMAPFKESVCYYYHGKIYNPTNDRLLAQIKLKGNIEGFAEDVHGNVLIEERSGLHLVSADSSLKNIDSIHGLPIRNCTSICRSASGHFLVQAEENIWNFADSFSLYKTIPFDGVSPLYVAMNMQGVVYRASYLQSAYQSFATGKMLTRSFGTTRYMHISYSIPSDGDIYFNEATGVTQLDPETTILRRFLPGVRVSKSYRDREKNLWFTTLDHGIYRLNSEEFKTVKFSPSPTGTMSVTTINAQGSDLWVGTDHDQLFRLTTPDFRIVDTIKFLGDENEKVHFADTCGRGLIISSGYGIFYTDARHRFKGSDVIATKWVRKLNGDQLILGSVAGVFIYSRLAHWITDTLWRERSTTGFTDGHVIYFGTMGGMYKINPDRSLVFLGQNIPFLRKRISSIALAPDGTLWVASYDDAGVVGIRHDSVIAILNKKQGLTSDICRSLLINDGVLWIGTDKGLNAVRLDVAGYPTIRYTSSDGLASDMIDYLYAKDSFICAGTPVGLTFFNPRLVQPGEPCRLRLLGVINSGQERIGDTANLSLSYRAKDIRIEYVGISYRSVGKVRYRYRMLGLDTNWRETNASFLDYPSLPSGLYTFQLQAMDKFDVRSNMLSLPFKVQTPFWEVIWFRILFVLLLAALTWTMVSWRIRYIRRRQTEREELVRQRAEMENKALAAQMNPHFIFNCLNSIQQFMFDKDMAQTNEYISGFARLIRATLNHSSKAFISLEEEVAYLSDYLALEKMRFKEKMNYSIEVSPAVDPFNTVLPPLLIQPYVENAMRHGLRNKPDGNGFISIRIEKVGNDLVILIEDNGIGRMKAMEYKTREHIEYQSKGMSMTASRIKLIGAVFGAFVRVEMEDRMTNGRPEGTKVKIIVPEFSSKT